MNQILFNPEPPITKKRKTNYLLKVQLIIATLVVFFCIIYFTLAYYKQQNNYKIANKLADNFGIIKLYANSTAYNATPPVLYVTEQNKFSVIALIEIEKLRINYPIISETSEDLLKLAPTKFAGPEPNEIGNFVIAGHNYVDARFFSDVNTLSTSDIITIVDLKRQICKL